jgi:hypothetical protein
MSALLFVRQLTVVMERAWIFDPVRTNVILIYI